MNTAGLTSSHFSIQSCARFHCSRPESRYLFMIQWGTLLPSNFFNRNGNLREKDLENFIFELIPSFVQLQNIPEAFHNYYVITAVRKFFFFLDPKKTGKIYIKDMLTSPILAELYDLRQEKTIDELVQNWFSTQNAQRVYEAYLKLDYDHNGLLLKSELSRYQWGLTQ